jgi:hypothetical protein
MVVTDICMERPLKNIAEDLKSKISSLKPIKIFQNEIRQSYAAIFMPPWVFRCDTIQ